MLRSTAKVLILGVFLTGCISMSRREAPTLDYSDAVPVGFPSSVRVYGETVGAFQEASAPVFNRVHALVSGGSINTLALSGGGAGGAFGAGVLVGWSQKGDRPEFEIVTGVSVGAIIAPFAFLGEQWDPILTEAFSGKPTEHLFQSHWRGALLGASLYHGEPLANLIDHFITEEVLQAVAVESAKGRLLLVATTDLDKEETVIWNMGVIAAQGGARALKLFRNVIVASASIPGLFPPVTIRVSKSGKTFDEMHVDGGTTASLFIAPTLAALLRDRMDGLHGANEYILKNG